MSELTEISDLKVEVRGHSRFQKRAPLVVRILAGVADLGVGVFLLFVAYFAFALPPVLDWKLGPALAAAILVPWGAGRAIFGTSLGEAIWKIRSEQTQIRDLSYELRGGFLTLLIFGLALGIARSQFLSHPYWSSSPALEIPAAIPPASWRVQAFYYSMAPWPIAISGQPVFYSIPYETAPPRRFLGHIQTDWIPDSVRLTFEGPKTPFQYQSRVRNRHSVHECFSVSPVFHPGCVDVREITLGRHLKELRAQGYTKFQATWFSADNPTIPPKERAQGVRLRARAGEKIEDRYILITPQGIHEAISLSYLDTPTGHDAERKFLIALGDLRISDGLDQGRAWTAQVLSSTRLADLPSQDSPAYLQALSNIQASLVSELSVNPASFDAYYHLAGSSMLLLKFCVKHPHPELRSLAQVMVERMDRFAHDVDPANSRISEMDRLVQEAKRF